MIYKKKAILFLMILLVLFSLIIMASLFSLRQGTSFVSLGMGPKNENIAMIVLSFMGVIWALVELVQVEKN